MRAGTSSDKSSSSSWPEAMVPLIRHSGAPRSGEPGIHEHQPVFLDSGFGPSGRPGLTFWDSLSRPREPGFAAGAGEGADAADIGGALGDADDAARVQQVEQMAFLLRTVDSRDDDGQ